MTDNDKGAGMTPLREAAISAHEIYTALREGGFSRSEAIELVARVLMVGIENLPGDTSGK